MKPFTVILTGTDDDSTITVHHVEAENTDDAIREALIEAEVVEADDAVVFEGHHYDIRTGPVGGVKLTATAK